MRSATTPLSSLTDPDQVLKRLFEKTNGRPMTAWNHLCKVFPGFTAKPLSSQVETLKKIAACVAYFRGAQMLDSARRRAKASFASANTFGIGFDKVNDSASSELSIRIPARLLGGFQAAISVKSESEKSIACAVSAIAHQAKPLVGSLPKDEES